MRGAPDIMNDEISVAVFLCPYGREGVLPPEGVEMKVLFFEKCRSKFGRIFKKMGDPQPREGLLRPEADTACVWRMGWDSNPRDACTPAGFQDRCHQPLGHPSTLQITPHPHGIQVWNGKKLFPGPARVRFFLKKGC